MSPYYRRPAQYLAVSMGCGGYKENDVMTAIKTLRRLASEKGFTDVITKNYFTPNDCHKSVFCLWYIKDE